MTTALLKDVPPFNSSLRVTFGDGGVVDVFLGDEQARKVIRTNKTETVFIITCIMEIGVFAGKLTRSILIDKLPWIGTHNYAGNSE